MKKTIVLSLMFLGLFGVCPSRLKADDFENTTSRATVLPAKFELWGKAEETLEQTLMITNEDEHDALLAISVENFGVTGQDGEIALGESAPGYPTYLSKWITFDQRSMRFAPKQTKFIKFKIEIPKFADPGGKYAAIILSMDRVIRNPGEKVATAKVVSLVMLTVAGDIRDTAAVESLITTKDNESGNYNFELSVHNNGNNHIRPSGTIVVTSLLGKKIDEIPLNGENVLPGVTRRMTTEWDRGGLFFGRYNATVIASYGQKINNRSFSETTTFYVWPRYQWVALIVLIVLALFIGTGRRKRKRTRQR